MDKALRNAVIVGILVSSISFGYYLTVFLPQKNDEVIKMKKQETQLQVRNKNLLDDCLSRAQQSYLAEWSSQCYSYISSVFGDVENNPTCKLPDSYAKIPNEHLASYKNDCFRLYPQN
jgi:hypothetical protein